MMREFCGFLILMAFIICIPTLLIAGFGGCGSKVSNPYTIQLINQDGEVIKTWEIESTARPQVITHWGGGVSVLADDRHHSQWEKETKATEGFTFLIWEGHDD